MHLYIPWWKFDRKNEFLRGYHIEFGGGREHAGSGRVPWRLRPIRRLRLQPEAALQEKYGAYIGLSGRGEMIPNPNTYCEIDPNVVDEWGIPVLRFHFQWGENEIKMARDMQETFRAIVEAVGGTYLTKTESTGEFPYGIPDGRRQSSTKSAPRAWGKIPRLRPSTDFARPTT